MEKIANISERNNGVKNAENLFARFQQGETRLFSSLYNMHVRMLYNYGTRFTYDKELLKDCIQDVFIKIYNKRAEIGEVNNFKSYLLISLRNRVCDEIRKRVNISDVLPEEINTLTDVSSEVSYMAQEKEVHKNTLVYNLLDQLPPRQRQALNLYYIEERKYEDICEIMNMNYQSVRNLMHRALTKLRSITPEYASAY